MEEIIVEFDFSKLRGRIVEKFGTIAGFCDAADISMQRMSARLNNRHQFQPTEIKRFCMPDLLDIADEEIPAYFFVPKVR